MGPFFINMRKKIVFTFLLSFLLFLFCGCKDSPNLSEEKTPIKEYDYSDVNEYFISWKNAFLQSKSQYFVYIFSKTCLHCLTIKQEILAYKIEKNYPIYFCEFSNDICTDISRTDEVCILGTPTLIDVINNEVLAIASGTNEIKNMLLDYAYN